MIEINMGKEKMFIRSDCTQWSIGKVRKDKKTGEDVFYGEWYYTTVEAMMKNLLQRKVRCEEANTLQELSEVVKRCTDELMGMYELNEFGFVGMDKKQEVK